MTASTPTAILIRDSRDADLPAIAAIYAHHVLHGTASFELEPPGLEALRERRAAVLDTPARASAASCWRR
ncbi:acetyltransferase [Bordetella pertussis]|nr:acetyltransferase [Bordetella pertussis]